MELETYHWITLAGIFILIVMNMISEESILAPDDDLNAMRFVYEQCLNESGINITYSTGTLYLAKENDVCMLKVSP